MAAIRTIDHNQGAIAAAAEWVADSLLGSAAISTGILAIAAIGIAMLWGRLDLRFAGRTVLGVFILFGAPMISYELMQTLGARETATPDIAQSPDVLPPAVIPKNAPVNDPYAGAAVPQLQ